MLSLYRVSLTDEVPANAGDSFEMMFEGKRTRVRLREDSILEGGVYRLFVSIVRFGDGAGGTQWVGTGIALVTSQVGEGIACKCYPAPGEPDAVRKEVAKVHEDLLARRANAQHLADHPDLVTSD